VEDVIAKCPVGKVVLVEPYESGRYFVRQGIVEKAVAVVSEKIETTVVVKPVIKPKKSKKKGKKNDK